MISGKVHSFETLGTLDGPGVRFVVFLTGCPLRCLYCHNPDTWDLSSGKEMSSVEIVEKAKRYKPYFASSGGITISGGEPMMQPEFVADIFRQCKSEGISTCLDTSGALLNKSVKACLDFTDLVMLDVKHTDAQKYKELTGGSLESNRAFLDYCKSKQIPLWIRQVILPGWTSAVEDMDSLLSYIEGANVKKIELLPYHTLGVHKWKAQGLEYRLEGLEPPMNELMETLLKKVSISKL